MKVLVAVKVLFKSYLLVIKPHWINFVDSDQIAIMKLTGMRDSEFRPGINFFVAKIEERLTAVAIVAKSFEWAFTIIESQITEVGSSFATN